MKHFLSITKTFAVCATSLFLFNCTKETDNTGVTDKVITYKGDFRLSEEARSYIVKDTLATTFKMIDNNGVIVDFVISPGPNGKYLSTYKDGSGSYESFDFNTSSVSNSYSFNYHLAVNEKSSQLYLNNIWYDFKYQTTSGFGDLIPWIELHDEMEVKGIVYDKIVEMDYYDIPKGAKEDFPIQIIYSADKGLIKFIRKDGIYFERI